MADGTVDGQITLAVVQRDILELKADVHGLREDLKALLAQYDSRIRATEMHCAGCVPQLISLQKDMDGLKTRSTVWESINSIGAFIAGVIAFLKGP